MSNALLAVASLILGVALNEWIRRSNRIESYSTGVFERRLRIYEELWKRVLRGSDVAETVIDDTALTAEQRHELVSAAVLSIAEFCDENNLFLNEEVTVQCSTLFMDVENIQDEPNATRRKQLISRYRDAYRQTLEILRTETGLKRINELFHSLTKAEHSSEVIEYFRKLQNERRTRSHAAKRGNSFGE